MSDPVLHDGLSGALLAIQQELDGVVRDAENAGFKRNGEASTYATIESVIDAVKPIANKHGVLIHQTLANAPFEGQLALKTKLIHARSGEFLEDTAVVPLKDATPQGYGSAVTYTRRYSLVTAFLLKTQDDDDGNKASGVEAPAGKVAKPAGAFPGQKAKATPAPKSQEKAEAPARPKKNLFPVPKTTANVEDVSGETEEEDNAAE